MIYHHQLEATSPLSLQIFDLRRKLEKPTLFITKHIDANIASHLNLAKIFFLHWKLNSIVIKITNKLFIFLWNFSGLVICLTSFLSTFLIFSWCSFEGLICLTWHHKKHFWSLFLMLISPFNGLLIFKVSLCKNFLIKVYKLKC